MGAQKVVVSNPESQVIVGAVDVVKAVCMAVRSLISTVEPFDHLFEWTVFCGDSIVVGKTNDLSDLERKVFAHLLYDFHCGEGVRAVTVRDELKVLRQLCKSLERHAHSEDAGANATVVRYLVTDDGTGGGVHDKPDVGFDPADLYVCLVGGEHIPFFVRVLVHEWFDADGGSLAVVGDLLVRDADAVKVFQGL